MKTLQSKKAAAASEEFDAALNYLNALRARLSPAERTSVTGPLHILIQRRRVPQAWSALA